MENTIFYHAKKINKRYLALIDIINQEKDTDILNEAHDQIRCWPKTHTFCFKKAENNKLYVTWSKVYKGKTDYIIEDIKQKLLSSKLSNKLYNQVIDICNKISNYDEGDIFNKKEGKIIAIKKMERFLEHKPRNIITKTLFQPDGKLYNTKSINKEMLFSSLPAEVASTLPWYFSRAIRYFKINENIQVNIEGKLVEVSDYFNKTIKRGNIVIYKNELLELV